MGEPDPPIRIRTAAGREADVGALLATSFADSPGSVSRRLPPARRFRLLRGMLTAATCDLTRHGQVLVALEGTVADGGDADGTPPLLGALLMVAPGCYPVGPLRRMRAAPATLRAACAAPLVFPAWRRSVAARSATLPPAGDWWLLHSIAVAPRAHRRGIGRMLLRHGLEAVDATGLPCYLHTASPAAEALVREFGFVAHGPVIEADRHGPPYVMMRRPGRDRS